MQETTMEETRQIIIIGAGTTGLLLAQGLKQVGISATVYERESSQTYHNRPREWGMTLNTTNESIPKVLPENLRARFRETWCDPHYKMPKSSSTGGHFLPQYAGHNNELLFKIDEPDTMRVSRNKMRRLFSEGVKVEFGKRVISIIQDDVSVRTIFSDGTAASGSLVVGCDGAHSFTREMLVGKDEADVSYLDYSCFNFSAKFDADTAKMIRAQHPIFMTSYHKNGYMFWLSVQDVPDPEKPETWSFQIIFSWAGGPKKEDLECQADRTNFLRSKASEYAEPWRTVLSRIPDDAAFEVDRTCTWRPVDWSAMPLAGKVTLAGDAAHAMTPNRGQGMQNGLQDAALLAQQLSNAAQTDHDWHSAIKVYEAEMRERALREIPISEAAAEAAHNYELLVNSPFVKRGAQEAQVEGQSIPAQAIAT